MSHLLRVWIPLPLLLASVTNCSESDDPESSFSDEEMSIIEEMSPLPPVPDDPTNKYADDAAAAKLGQRFFFEKGYSGALTIGDDGENGSEGEVGDTGKVGCVSCHQPRADFSDKRSQPGNVSLGVKYTTRNAPALVNVAFYEYYGWGGKQDSLWTQASLSPESSSNTGGDRCGYSRNLFKKYADEYEEVFGEALPEGLGTDEYPTSCKPKKPDDPDGAWEEMTDEQRLTINTIMANSGKAIAAYERLLISDDAPFDRFVAGDDDAISVAAKRGLRLFIGKAACVDCHSGPTFSDNEFYNTGVPQKGPNVPEEDLGRAKDLDSAKGHEFNTGSVYSDNPKLGKKKLDALKVEDDDLGAFRTKALRNVEHTAPYMHTGAFETLEEVVDFYSDGGVKSGFVGEKTSKMQPLNLSDDEKADLVEFLLTLTGKPLPDTLLRKLKD